VTSTSSHAHSFTCCDLEPSQAMEKYLKTIYLLSFTAPPVTTSCVATRMGVAAPSVSAMLRRLEAAGLLIASDSGVIELSEHGEHHARSVVRRHRLIETFLVRAVGLSWDEVHVEAEALEHAASDRLIEAIDASLGHPANDPHGDPIPPPAGAHVEAWSPPLAEAPLGVQFRVDRISDQDSDALRYLAELGVGPGLTLTVLRRDPFDGPLWIDIAGHPHAIAPQLARLIHGIVVAP
jgi:DtxR family Mn-dependent transcriptional regulator